MFEDKTKQHEHVKTTVGVYFRKNQKIIALEKSNMELKQILDALMLEHDAKSSFFKDQSRKIVQLETQNGLRQIEAVMNASQIATLEFKMQSIEPQMQELQTKLDQMTSQNNSLQKQLQKKVIESQQQKSLLRRYEQEQKMRNKYTKADRSLCNAYDKLLKQCETWQKNHQILLGKLQAKKRYLQVLTQKQQKEKKRIQQKDNQLKKTSMSSLKRLQKNPQTHSSLSNYCSSKHLHNQSSTVSSSLLPPKADMKSFSQQIRLKNNILSRRK